MPRPAFTKFSPAIRDKALLLAKEIGVGRASLKLKLSRSTLTTWRQQAGDARNGTVTQSNPVPTTNGARSYHSAEEKVRVLEIASRIGIDAAATETGISTTTIYKWRKAQRRPTAIAPLWFEGFRAGFAEGFILGQKES